MDYNKEIFGNCLINWQLHGMIDTKSFFDEQAKKLKILKRQLNIDISDHKERLTTRYRSEGTGSPDLAADNQVEIDKKDEIKQIS